MSDILLPWLGFMMVFLLIRDHQITNETRRSLARLEMKLESIRAHLGVDLRDNAMPAEVEGLIKAGRKIEAIKVYREQTGAGLKEAKEAVERGQARIITP